MSEDIALGVNLKSHFTAVAQQNVQKKEQQDKLLESVPKLLDAATGVKNSDGEEETLFDSKHSKAAVSNQEDLMRFVNELFTVYSYSLMDYRDWDERELDYPRFMLLLRKVLEVYRVNNRRLSERAIADVLDTTERTLCQRAAAVTEEYCGIKRREVCAFMSSMFQHLEDSPLLLKTIL